MIDGTDPSGRQLRILHVLRAPLGGLYRHVIDLATEQVARGHSVGLVVDSLTGGDRAAAHLLTLQDRFTMGVKRLPMPRAPHFQDIAALRQTNAHAHKLDVDVIHGHGSKGGLYARFPGLFQRKDRPIRCYTPHGGSFNHSAPPLIQSLYMNVEKLLAHRTDVLFFESVYIANRFHQSVGDTQALIRIVQNGISLDEIVPVISAPDAADFVYVGELRSAKGIDTLIDATALLTAHLGRRLKLVLVGTGPDQEKLAARAKLRGIGDDVSFPGAMPARVAFTKGRVLVVPSRKESLPYVVLEGAGAQIPMVATDVGGIGEIFGPYRDRLISCDDPQALANAMKLMVEMDPGHMRRQAEVLATFVKSRFLLSIMADHVIDGYRDALLKRGSTKTGVTPALAVPS